MVYSSALEMRRTERYREFESRLLRIMKISVLIVAHNEQKDIARCIESLLEQTVLADEIVLIVHNSIDNTTEIAKRYPVRIIEYEGPTGPAFARIKGFEEVTGDIVLCIDGDAYAAKNWVEELSNLLKKPGVVLAGSWVRMYGTLYAETTGPRWYFPCNTKDSKSVDWLFGASFGFWIRDRVLVIDALRKGLVYSKELGLAINPDDYWIALHMIQRGTVSVTNRTWVKAHAKEETSLQGLMRGWVSWFSVRRRVHGFLKRVGMETH